MESAMSRYLFASLTVTALSATPVFAIDLVKGGKPVATIVTEAKPEGKVSPKAKKKQPDAVVSSQATRLLVEWIKKITDAELPVANKAPDGPTIYIGKAAIDAELKLDDIDSPTQEGLRIVVEENRILIAGLSEPA